MKRSRLNAIINAILSVRSALSDADALNNPLFFPEWNDSKSYAVDDRVLYDGILYKCLQPHTSQPTWTPSETPSLWARVLIPGPDVISEWVQPDSTNPYMTGDKVTHNNKTWVSNVDNNVWEPGVYGWNEVINE